MTNSSHNALTLSSQNGVEVEVALTPDAASGTITTSEDGEADEPYDFEAKPATAIEGYYPVRVPTGEGKLVGTSWSGAKLEGTRRSPHISVKITPPGGGIETVSFRAHVPTIRAGENRWILLREEGQLRGRANRRATFRT